ncbi:MAG TPA: class I SAM-dependent methyltransferase [Gammaproteobacteria bacterium]|nr:class I SAM-dependent methyltransferase [Gammaproteobacteria bacterium]
METFSDAKIIDSWLKNASPWTAAVREGQIESRQLVTNRAIIDAILGRSPQSVLDIGCGEGWLARELSTHSIHVDGVDAVGQMINQAKSLGGGNFHVISYEEITAGKLETCADVVVCNFALLGKESVEGLFGAVPTLMQACGTFIVQTLHPVTACGALPYRDGWREGSWCGFSDDFTDPAPWYFRTLESWITLFVRNGFGLLEMREPCHPKTQKPASVIFIAEARVTPAGNRF